MRWLRRVLVGAAVLFVLAEGAARLVVGTPILYETDPAYEYRLRPDQDTRRFGNRVLVNGAGMRSGPLAPHPQTGQLRILVLGDSVVNDGARIDHDALATTRLDGTAFGADRLEVLNLAAGSWGPGNYTAMLARYGLHDADGVVVVLSAHDLNDDRTHAWRDPVIHPETPPLSVLVNSVRRYLLPRPPPPPPANPRPGDARASIETLFSGHFTAPVPLCIVVHTRRGGGGAEDRAEIVQRAAAHGVPVATTAAYLDPETDFRDDIHLNEAGQDALARALRACIDQMLTPGRAS